MPLFFIVAGYFYRVKDPLTSIKVDIKRLYVSNLCVSCFWFIGKLLTPDTSHVSCHDALKDIFAVLYGNCTGVDGTYLSSIPIIGPIWFVLALFWCKNIYNEITIRFKSNPYKITTACIMLSILAMFIHRHVINLPLGISQGVFALVFYHIGNNWRNCKQVSKILIATCMLGWVATIYLSFPYLVTCDYKYYPVQVIGAFGGTYVIYLIARQIAVTKRTLMISSSLQWIGKASLLLLGVHTLDNLINPFVCEDFKYYTLYVIERITICLMTAYLLSKIKAIKKIFIK